MIVKRKLYSFVDEERLFARGKNIRNLGKGNKTLNKKLKRDELINAGKPDVINMLSLDTNTMLNNHKLDVDSVKKGAAIADARLKKNADVVISSRVSKLNPSFGNKTNNFDALNYNNLKDKKYRNYKLEELRRLKKEKAKEAAKQLRESRLTKAQQLRDIKNKKIRNAILVGTGAAFVGGAGLYAAKKYKDSKKEKED